MAAVSALAASVAGAGEDWLPVTPDELSMTGEPKAPRAPAILLHNQVDRDDVSLEESVYRRVKILTEEGRKYGNVEISFDQNHDRISGITARTIRPDGSIVKFDGTIYETPLVKARGVRYLAKTFTLPDVRVGSIVEYRYRRRGDVRYVFDSHWILNDELFTRHGSFTLVPNPYFVMSWAWPQGVPEGSGTPEKVRGKVQLETHDVPAFVTEELMPPENALLQRVDFLYFDRETPTDAGKFWAEFAHERYRQVESFTDKPRAMASALAQIVAAGDSPEAKLRKIYARVQRLRNLSFERGRTSEEERREKPKSIHNVADVWEYGYGEGEELTWLFLALARTAGFSADPMLVSTRDQYFFQPALMNAVQLNTNIVRVRLDGNDLYFDPGTLCAPFALLPWAEAGVRGLVLSRTGATWVAIPNPAAVDSRLEHHGQLQLSEDGTLAGHVTVTYSGLEALSLRIAEHRDDAAGRKRYLESELQADVPVGSNVELVNKPDWDSSTAILIAEFQVSVQGWMAAAGSRRLLPASLFGASGRQTFAHTTRVHPIYFSYPFRQDDDVTITLPASLKVDTVPQARSIDFGALSYHIASERTEAGLHQSRQLTVDGTLIPVKYYGQLHDFFQTVRNQDEEQIVLRGTGAAPR